MAAPQEPAGPERSTTVAGVAADLGADPVEARAVVEAILRRHDEYADRRAAPAVAAVAWPSGAPKRTVDDWLLAVTELFVPDAFPVIFGRLAVAGIALVDRATGRALADVGLLQAIVAEIRPGPEPPEHAAGSKTAPYDPGIERAFVEALAPEVAARLASLPLLRLSVGPALASVSLAHHAPLFASAITSDGRRIATAGSGRLRLWNATSGAELASAGLDVDPLDLAFTPDGGRLRVIGTDGRVRSWRLPDLAEDHRPFGEPGQLASAAMARDASRVVWPTGDGRVADVDLRNWWTEYRDPPSELGRIEAVGLARDGSAIVAGGGGQLATHGPGGWLVLELPLRGGDVLAVDRRGVGLATTGPGTPPTAMRPDDGGSGVDLHEADRSWPPLGTVAAVAFAGDDRLAYAGENRIGLVHLRSGLPLATWDVGTEVTGLTTSLDGRWLLAMGRDATVRRYWTSSEPEPAAPPPARFAGDTPTIDRDDLGVGAVVDGFASLIASRSVEPPLAIGLFGEWGSGKTTFMRQLRRRIEQLTADARDSRALQRDVGFFKRVIQVEFNAWHYSEGNLWASLVQHLLDNLRLFGEEPDDLVEARRQEVLTKLQLTDRKAGAAQQQMAAADRRVEFAEAALDRARTDEQRARQTLRDLAARRVATTILREEIRDEVVPVAKAAGIDTAVASVSDAIAALDQARTVLHGATAVFRPTVGDDEQARRARRFAVLALLAPLVGVAVAAGLAALDVGGLRDAAAIATAAVAILGTAAKWLREKTVWLGGQLDRVDAARRRVDDEVERLTAVQRAEREAAEADLADAVSQRDLQREKVAALRNEARQYRDHLATITPTRVLADLIVDRHGSGDYEKHLGLMATVRNDFERISRQLLVDNEAVLTFDTLEQEEREAAIRINRIVLYIDDLDRCEPSVVAQVLQAVHLLLAYPLFVVVVGVDARWIRRALVKEMPTLLGDPSGSVEGATPEDYLEKIFQIPYWLQPLDRSKVDRLLDGLVGTAADLERPATADEPSGGEPPPPVDAVATADRPDGVAAPAGARSEQVAGSADLNPVGLRITADERSFMAHLAPLLDRSPRAVKRFVNVYRLVKVVSPDPWAFEEDRGPASLYRAAQLLLALATSRPTVAEWLLDRLVGAGADLPATLDELANRHRVGGGEADTERPEEVDQFLAWLASDPAAPVRSLALTAVREVAPDVVRFSFLRSPAALDGNAAAQSPSAAEQ